MDTTRELEETLRALVRHLLTPQAEQWRMRVAAYADQVARGNATKTGDFLAMYHQGGMGSFLDLQGATAETHDELVRLRHRAYTLASDISSAHEAGRA